MNVLLLHDQVGQGSSTDELDVLVQMDAIESALAELGHHSERLACTLDLSAAQEAVRGSRTDVVFNLVESLAGHGRLIHVAPSLLDVIGVSYTGCPSAAVWLTSNKLVAKQLMQGAGLATPDWYTLDQLERGVPISASRYIIKSVWEHASRGLDEDSVIDADSPQVMAAALRGRLAALGGEGFAEQYINGREFNLSLISTETPDSPRSTATRPVCEVLPPAEIVFEGFGPAKTRVVGYRAKWDEGSFEFHHTPRRFEFDACDDALLERLRSMAVNCWQTFGLRGYARVDFRVNEQGTPFILEVNTNPCLSPDAGFAAALQRAGIPFRDAIARIIADIPGCRQ